MLQPQPLPAGFMTSSCASGLFVVTLFPTVCPYNSSSVPGWMSWHTRRHTSTHSPTHTSPPQAHCTATFCWAPLRTWQANLREKKTQNILNLNVLNFTARVSNHYLSVEFLFCKLFHLCELDLRRMTSDHHAPFCTRSVTFSQSAPWYTSEL